MIHLTPRQQMAADLIRPGRPLADIGTDHAQLPAALLQQGLIPFAWCMDVRKGPLENARATIEACGLTDRTELILCNGFTGLPPGTCHDFVVAGMGGVLTVSLFEAAPWLKDPENHFVLQPQSHLEELRRYLYENGYKILQETAVLDHHRPYTAMEVVYTGEIIPFTTADCYLGKMPELADRELRERYLQSIDHYLEDQIRGGCPEQEELRGVLQIVKGHLAE